MEEYHDRSVMMEMRRFSSGVTKWIEMYLTRRWLIRCEVVEAVSSVVEKRGRVHGYVYCVSTWYCVDN